VSASTSWVTARSTGASTTCFAGAIRLASNARVDRADGTTSRAAACRRASFPRSASPNARARDRSCRNTSGANSPGSASAGRPNGSSTTCALLPVSVFFSTRPPPKSIVTIGTGRTDCQCSTNCSRITRLIRGSGYSSALKNRLFAQVSSSGSRPSRRSDRIGLPARCASATAAGSSVNQVSPCMSLPCVADC